MRNLFKSIILAFLTIPAMAQIPAPQINLGGNIGCQGFPCLNSGTLQFTGDADRNMTVQETSATGGIKVTSTVPLTATRNLILPTGNFQFIAVENATTGGQSIQVIGQSGTGVTIANGQAATVWFDGTNVVQTGSSSGGAVFPGTNGVVFNTSTTASRNATFSDIVPLWGSGSCSGFLKSDGTCSTGSVAPFPGTNNIVFNTSTTASRNATATDINTLLGYTPAVGPNFTNDFVACYLFLETPTASGSLPDHCGSNNGTVGTTAPTTDGVGWRWQVGATLPATSGVVLPAALNSAKTYYFTVSVPPATAGNYLVLQVNTVLGGVSSGGLDINVSNVTYGNTQTFGGFGAFENGVTTDNAPNVFNGLAILTLVCNTSGIDTLYVNGHLTTNAGSGTACGHMTGGNTFQIGASGDSANFKLVGELYDLRVSNNAHTAAQVQQNVAALTNEMVGRGVSFLPSTYQYPTQQLFAAGDSITCGYQSGGSPQCVQQPTPWTAGSASSNAFTNHLTLDQTFAIQNFGAVGAQVQQQIAAAPQLYSPFCQTQSGNSIAMLFEGTNNGGINTPAQTWALTTSWAQTMHAAGCKTIYIGMISRGGSFSGLGGGTYENFRYAYNALARANWKQAGFDAFVDSDADPFLGCTSCFSNTTYYLGDQIHLTAAGQLKLALEVQQAINVTSNGSSITNPNPTVITASTYTFAYEDGAITFNTAANNINATLLSAQWQSGRIIQACNTSTSGTNTLTLTAPSDYPFNNVSGFTSVIVPNGSCQKFQATFVTGTPNGDFWSIVPTAPTTGPFTNGNLRTTTAGVAADSGIASSNVPLLNASNTFTGSLQTVPNLVATATAEFGAVVGASHQVVINPAVAITGYNSSDVSMYSFSNISGFGTFAGPLTAASTQTTIYTVSTLPSAASLPAGTQVTVSDDTGLPTSNTCTGGGSQYAIAITNGTSWTCH